MQNHFISNSEDFVRIQVQAANQQDLVVQGVKCLLYKACSIYCTSVPCGQTFCDLPTHLHLFYRIFHSIRINNCDFFLVYSVILGIFWVTLSCKHMWGSVQVIWMILACATYTHFIYHPMWASCSELQYSKTWWDKNLKSNMHEYLTISWP